MSKTTTIPDEYSVECCLENLQKDGKDSQEKDMTRKTYATLYFLGIKDLRQCAQYTADYFIKTTMYLTFEGTAFLEKLLQKKGIELQSA